MVGCAAPNCSNHSRNGFKFFRFPADPDRRKKWLINCRRQQWVPTQNDRLCSVHFEESQVEENRADGQKRLKPFAVPTIFNVTNPPKLITLFRRNKRPKLKGEQKGNYTVPNNYDVNLNSTFSCNSRNNAKLVAQSEPSMEHENIDDCSTTAQVSELRKRITNLEQQLNIKNEALSKFLTPEQVEKLQIERKCIKKWSSEAIVKGLKLRFALGKNGYNFLRETGYPAPSYSTLNKRVSSVEVGFGLLHSIVNLLSKKVETMTEIEKDCSLMVDEMEISGDLDFDKSKKTFVGQVTLGVPNKRGNHLTVVALRGLNTPWKQILACHVTGPTTTGNDMKILISQVIHAAVSVGLNVRSICSDMGSNNKALWVSLGVCVNRLERITGFKEDNSNEDIQVLADGPHLLKNWKQAIANSKIYIPEDVMKENSLPTNVVSGKYIHELWDIETKNERRLRSLHHLTEEIVSSAHFSKMNVGYAMRYISIKTAAALETAVIQKILPPAALTTAWFIRLLRQWFDLINSRKRASSITAKNLYKKEEFILYFVSIIERTVIGKGWKPLNTGSVLTSLSFIHVAKKCFERGYKFLLGSRLSQDGLENIFSQIRKRAGMKPSALSALRVVKLICLSQFMSDVKNTNYCSDSDLHLLDYSQIEVNNNKEGRLLTSGESTLTMGDKTNIHYIAGSCVNYLFTHKNICEECKQFLQNPEDSFNTEVATLSNCLDLGGLKKISEITYRLLEDAECAIQDNMEALLKNTMSFSGILKHFNIKYNTAFPQCCNILQYLLEHYVIVRGAGIKSFEIASKKKTVSYGSKSVHKKTV